MISMDASGSASHQPHHDTFSYRDELEASVGKTSTAMSSTFEASSGLANDISIFNLSQLWANFDAFSGTACHTHIIDERCIERFLATSATVEYLEDKSTH